LHGAHRPGCRGAHCCGIGRRTHTRGSRTPFQNPLCDTPAPSPSPTMHLLFPKASELLALCKTTGLPTSEIAIRREEQETGAPRADILARMETHFRIMRESVKKRLSIDSPSPSGLSGGGCPEAPPLVAIPLSASWGGFCENNRLQVRRIGKQCRFRLHCCHPHSRIRRHRPGLPGFPAKISKARRRTLRDSLRRGRSGHARHRTPNAPRAQGTLARRTRRRPRRTVFHPIEFERDPSLTQNKKQQPTIAKTKEQP